MNKKRNKQLQDLLLIGMAFSLLWIAYTTRIHNNEIKRKYNIALSALSDALKLQYKYVVTKEEINEAIEQHCVINKEVK